MSPSLCVLLLNVPVAKNVAANISPICHTPLLITRWHQWHLFITAGTCLTSLLAKSQHTELSDADTVPGPASRLARAYPGIIINYAHALASDKMTPWVNIIVRVPKMSFCWWVNIPTTASERKDIVMTSTNLTKVMTSRWGTGSEASHFASRTVRSLSSRLICQETWLSWPERNTILAA